MEKIIDKNSYLKSISERNLKIYLMGELVEDPLSHPIIKPSVEAMAETYELAVREPELASVLSPYTGESINRFLPRACASPDRWEPSLTGPARSGDTASASGGAGRPRRPGRPR
jgi:4-hydroxybutyryl-CoA dehydratase/vinylacetyl-CoA-Delta-isomerase